ncbi:hypothetical protein [Streptomyces sp. PT12]|uniref:hypothetical protein n=1 Tax=Streptomyces sp. PT12 TaxID=1510197 RepID=UPI000DE3072E|nr:hypothetical protein [Streptomyces sp. PT12]RBM20218.1 hypothetical protein DEH69_08780 [Streptomyces sp. PT12]
MRRLCLAGATLAVSVTAVGCGGSEERDYALPGDFCGVDMPEELYAPLFPGGSELSVSRSFDEFGNLAVRFCRMSVDDEIILTAESTGTGSFGDTESWDLGPLDPDDTETVPGEFGARVSPGVAMALAPCTVPGPGGEPTIETLKLVLETEHPGDDEESKDVLAGLVQPLMAGAMEMTPCQEHGED